MASGGGGLRSAGMAIGIIERVMVLTFVLVDQYTAITIVFAAKSIARFNELEDRNMAEVLFDRYAFEHNIRVDHWNCYATRY